MSRKWKRILSVVLVLGLLTGCGSQEKKKGYTVYYISSEGTKLTEVSYDPAAETFDEMMNELLGQLAQAPKGSISALPPRIRVNGYERGIDALRIDFSKEFYELNNMEEVLLRAAVIKTISQIPGVTKIMITVEGKQLVNQHGNLVPAMDAASFIDTREGGINSYQYATLTFYFADSSGKRLVEETREVHYSSNMVMERVVLEQLIRGPENSSGKAVIAGAANVLTLNVNDGICTVNFDSEFNKAPAESSVDPETALYAIVNSVCGACREINGMKFEINGENDILFRDQVDLAQTFTPRMQLVETEKSADEGFDVMTQSEMLQYDGQTEMEETSEEETVQETSTELDGTSGAEVSVGQEISGEQEVSSDQDTSGMQEMISGQEVKAKVGVDSLMTNGE